MSALTSLLESDRPVLTLGGAEHVMVSRREWDELHEELDYLRKKLGKVCKDVKYVDSRADGIVEIAAELFGVEKDWITSARKFHPLPEIRIAIYKVCQAKGIHHRAIAVALHRHRSTAVKWKSDIESFETDRLFRANAARLEAACN